MQEIGADARITRLARAVIEADGGRGEWDAFEAEVSRFGIRFGFGGEETTAWQRALVRFLRESAPSPSGGPGDVCSLRFGNLRRSLLADALWAVANRDQLPAVCPEGSRVLHEMTYGRVGVVVASPSGLTLGLGEPVPGVPSYELSHLQLLERTWHFDGGWRWLLWKDRRPDECWLERLSEWVMAPAGDRIRVPTGLLLEWGLNGDRLTGRLDRTGAS